MKHSLKMTVLLVSFALVSSLASANNFSKSAKSSAPAEALKAETPVVVETPKTEAPLSVEVAPAVVAPVVKSEAPVKVEIAAPAKIETPIKAEAPKVAEAPKAKAEAPKAPGAPAKPAAGKNDPYEIMTFDRTLLVCPEGFACSAGTGTDFKCVPDKSQMNAGHGEVCKTTPREAQVAAPVAHKK